MRRRGEPQRVLAFDDDGSNHNLGRWCPYDDGSSREPSIDAILSAVTTTSDLLHPWKEFLDKWSPKSTARNTVRQWPAQTLSGVEEDLVCLAWREKSWIRIANEKGHQDLVRVDNDSQKRGSPKQQSPFQLPISTAAKFSKCANLGGNDDAIWIKLILRKQVVSIP